MIFNHLHVHTQFSLLDGAASITNLFEKAKKDGMRGLAITDHGNMFGVFDFVSKASKFEGVKPIVGCEFYMVEEMTKKTFTKEQKDVRFHQLLLAKNAKGYQNLVKLCSLGFIEGQYGKYPRIDKKLLLQYHEGLIATTCCLGAIVPRTILRKGEEEGEKEFKWWLDLFGENYFVELQRHGIGDQDKVNEVLVRLARKYNVKIIASNDSHYVDREDWNAHDILLCINTGEKQSTPSAKDFDEENPMPRGTRFAFFNDQFYFKTSQEMSTLFADLPEAIDNTNLIVDSCETLKLKQDIMLPHYKIPEGFTSQDAYLRHLTYQGAAERYKIITPEAQDRLDFELGVIESMGFAGYFLIVQDFINHGRDIGVLIGPGRGSAAGSAVAYCIGITNIDPIKYNLLFERFLNPDRKSMPDIDTDFDDEGREKVINYVVEKYGKNQVAQIVTYGTMAAKTSIKDVARVLDLPLADANALAKLVPEKPGISLKRLLTAPIKGDGGLEDKEGLDGSEMTLVNELREIFGGHDDRATVLKQAIILEGSVRNTGVHAAGIIIAPKDLSDILPVFTAKDSDLLITQFEGKIIEDAGVIKMDFLGLRTLTIMRDAVKMIEENHGVKIVLDELPLDDLKTYELYQRGDTNATFQFESAGMQKYLRELKPDKFEDLIAMNALYRPGPLEYIPDFIARKHGRQAISYDLADMEEYLSDTYGITVYQEQVMLLSQKLAGFTKGQADTLRKAMGKKDLKVLNGLKDTFMKGAQEKGHAIDKLTKIWSDWEAFAAYAFNKSHATCYAFVAYQTGYLKAHYPQEYMASVLTHNLSNIDKISFFMEETKRMGLKVLGPSVNESQFTFGVNKKGELRFGLGAVKGIGEAPVADLIKLRKEKGEFKNIFDFLRNVNQGSFNKRVFESLVLSGALDELEGIPNRATYFHNQPIKDSPTTIEMLVRWSSNFQRAQESMANSLFGEVQDETNDIPEPKVVAVEEWGLLEKLNKEKDLIGMYMSGHPLNDYRLEIQYLAKPLNAVTAQPTNKEFAIAGIITDVQHRVSQKGAGFGFFTIQDFADSYEVRLFSENYLKFKHLLQPNNVIIIYGINKPKYNDPQSIELRVNDIKMLEDVKLSNSAKGVLLRIPIQSISDTFIHSLTTILENNKGKQLLKAMVFDPERPEFSLNLRSEYQISISNELLNIFDVQRLEYSVIS